MDSNVDIVLASGSPRRKELLAASGVPFRVIVSDAEETVAEDAAPAEVAMRNAQTKALAVAQGLSPSSTVIGADTIVVLDGRIFGKPEDEDDAERMLSELSGRTHQVITGVCIVNSEGAASFAEVTEVTFKKLNTKDIDAYVATGEPLDKAGAYGIQGGAGRFVDRIEGDYDNVVGLPTAHLLRALDLERSDEIDDGQDQQQ